MLKLSALRLLVALVMFSPLPALAFQAGGAANGACAKARNDPASSSRAAELRPILAAKDAVWYNHPDELRALLADCVKVDQKDQYGWTLLHHAADRDRVPLAKILLDAGASSKVRNGDGKTAAQLASSAAMRSLLGASPAAAPASAAPAPPESPRRKMCNGRHYSSSALCSDSTCKMREYRKWQTCLQTGSYY